MVKQILRSISHKNYALFCSLFLKYKWPYEQLYPNEGSTPVCFLEMQFSLCSLFLKSSLFSGDPHVPARWLERVMKKAHEALMLRAL